MHFFDHLKEVYKLPDIYVTQFSFETHLFSIKSENKNEKDGPERKNINAVIVFIYRGLLTVTMYNECC